MKRQSEKTFGNRYNQAFAFSRKKSNVHDPLIKRKKGEPEIDPGYFGFDIHHFYSLFSQGEITVHADLLERIIQRLLSQVPGTDFIQKSGIARDIRYFNRPESRALLLEKARAHRWLLLEAVRRFGKTSFMVHLEDQPPEDFTVIYVSSESGTSRDFFAYALMANALGNKTLKALVPRRLKIGLGKNASSHQIFKHLKDSQRDGKEDLRHFWKGVAKTETPVLFLLDELVIYLNNVLKTICPAQDRQQEDQWRAWVLELFALLDEAPAGIHFLMAGSMHLPVLLEARDIHLDLLEGMESLSLSPVPVKDMETLLHLSLLQERVIAEDREFTWIIGRFGGWMPSFLLYFVDLLGMACRDSGKLNFQEIKDLYQSLFNARHRQLFADLDEPPRRYQEFFPPGAFFTQRLQAMLMQAAGGPASAADLARSFHAVKIYDNAMDLGEQEKLWRQALSIASQDFCLAPENDSYEIACPLLAD